MNAGYLDEFLARCGVVQTKEGVPYLVSLYSGFQTHHLISELGNLIINQN